MASIDIRIDDDLAQRPYAELERLGVLPSDLLRQTLQYVAERGTLPFKQALVSEKDEALMAVVATRLVSAQHVKVSRDDLSPRIRPLPPLKERKKLADTLRQQINKKRCEVLDNPRVGANRLRSPPARYR